MERALLQGFLDEGLSLDAIAEEVGRAPSTISYWLNRHGLLASGAVRFGTKPALPEDTIAALAAEGKSVSGIAEEIGCTPDRVRRSLARLGLATRGSKNRAAAREAAVAGSRYVTSSACTTALSGMSSKAAEAIGASCVAPNRSQSTGAKSSGCLSRRLAGAAGSADTIAAKRHSSSTTWTLLASRFTSLFAGSLVL